MGYFDDIVFTYAGTLPECNRMTRTQLQPNWFWSLEYCRNGELFFSKNSECATKHDGPAVFWMSPGNFYHYGTINSNSSREHAWANCSGPRAERMIGSLDLLWPKGCVRLPAETEKVFSPCYFRMLDHINARTPSDRLQAVLRMEELIAMLTQLHITASDTPAGELKMQTLIEKIRYSPLDDYHFPEIARKQFHISYSGFRKWFVRVTRMAPHEFVMLHRIYYAMELLRDEALQIQEVSARCGFANISTFSRLFKQKMDISPSGYRKKYL